MLSTAQALEEWDRVLKLMNDIICYAAAQPGADCISHSLESRMQDRMVALQRHGLASPVTTWEQLLARKVPRRLLAACCELLALNKYAASIAAQGMAALLVGCAATELKRPPLAASHSNALDSSSSSSGRVVAMLWQDLEQSGLLQQLASQLRTQAQVIQYHLSDQTGGVQGVTLSSQTHNLLTLMRDLQQLQPSFLADSEAGRQCVVPALQLCMSSVQCIGRALEKTGQQEWMWKWLNCSWNTQCGVVLGAKPLLVGLLAYQQRSRGGSSSSSSSSTSGSSQHKAALAVMKAEPTAHILCLYAVVISLAHFIQQATGLASDSGSTSSNGAAAGGASRQPAAGSIAHEQWMALAPCMPAAYSSVLEQLGCSREVGLWLAGALLLSAGTHTGSDGLDSVCNTILGGFHQYNLLLSGLQESNTYSLEASQAPRLAALHVSMSAASLQWLSSMPPGMLLTLRENCLGVCRAAATASTYGQSLIRCLLGHQSALPAAGGSAQFMDANEAAAQLSATLLDKLLRECHGLQERGDFSTGSNSSSNRGLWKHDGASSGAMLLRSCEQMVKVLGNAFAAAAEPKLNSATDSLEQQSSLARGLQLPVSSARCCQLLQDCVRLADSAAAAAAADSAAAAAGAAAAASTGIMPSTSIYERLTPAIVCYAASLLGYISPGVAAGNVSSPDALQLFGLLCSWLKAYTSGNIAVIPMERYWYDRYSVCDADQLDVSTEVFATVAVMLKAALGSAAAGTHPGSSSSSSSSTTSSSSTSSTSSTSSSTSTFASHSTTCSSACTGALPWLVLLGRCCYACAVLVQRWQGNLECDDESSGSRQDTQGTNHIKVLAQNLQQLQSSLAGVVQWLAAADTVQQLTALGYQPQNLLLQLAPVAEALAALSDSLQGTNPAGGATAVLQAAQQQLQAAGNALACFAIPHACNNSACSNVSGRSEAQLVGGRSCICAGCRTARYCGRACQRAAWRQHKPVCKALAAAAAAAAAVAGVVAESAAGSGNSCRVAE